MKKKIQLLFILAILVLSCQTFAQDKKPKKEKKPKVEKTQPVTVVKPVEPMKEEKPKKEKKPKMTPVTTVPTVKPVVVTPVKTKPVSPVVNPKNPTPDPVIGTDPKGRTIYQGKRGGKYYLTANGNREYIKH